MLLEYGPVQELQQTDVVFLSENAQICMEAHGAACHLQPIASLAVGVESHRWSLPRNCVSALRYVLEYVLELELATGLCLGITLCLTAKPL
jgi:hypothetical protein